MSAPVIGVDALLALVAAVKRLRDAQIDGEISEGERGLLKYQQVQPCLPEGGLSPRLAAKAAELRVYGVSH